MGKRKKASDRKILHVNKEKPFSDYPAIATVAGYINPRTNSFPYETYLKTLKKNPCQESEKLRVLVAIYKMHNRNQTAAFDETASDFMKSGYLSRQEWELLCKAEAGNMKAIAQLVRANPEVIQLPFITDAIIALLREYRNTPIPKGTTIKDLKDKWESLYRQKWQEKTLPQKSIRKTCNNST